ncbi:crotonase [Rhodococcoides fascians]|uniref:enoyl-CoA hydratase/isomerase family protein n=1 Tax=Rhodococcoides fascians TaxID=1828 RepID=UPI000B9C43B1|nr:MULTISPECIES: enoyl-CoA hydratase-related protein [Rhodococcus]OZD68976.1 crotonase [Rhodococcus sp. 06-1059B-a]OZE81342.1 crotonase [Rhodococcus fascians]OZF10166.1 crotonase [Rhodococcus fascians]OZF13257.1 crotonase [Rhodococcus fascians]OZF59354.1 crotonase [Rhodococcus fascians]
MTELLHERVGPIVTLTIHRPEAYNALHSKLLDELVAAVAESAVDPAVRAVVITGSGVKAFSAGADLKELADMGLARSRAVMAAGQRAFRTIEALPIPVVAAVNGLALGGGFELVLASTFPILSERASLGLPESALGLIPGYGGTQRLPRAVGQRVAAHLMLTGSRLDAARAYELGLTPVPPVVPDKLMAVASDVAFMIADQGPQAVRSILQALEIGRDAPLDAGLTAETDLAASAIAGEESAEGISAFLGKRPARFSQRKGCR